MRAKARLYINGWIDMWTMDDAEQLEFDLDKFLEGRRPVKRSIRDDDSYPAGELNIQTELQDLP